MKFVRLAVYTVIVFGVIVSWEYCRDGFLGSLVDLNVSARKGTPENAVKQKAPDNTKSAQEVSVSAKTDEGNANAQRAQREEKVVNAGVSDALGLNFEKGFENIAKNAMHSVVNVATMQLIESGDRFDIPDIFHGSPFDDFFKDFFDFPQKKHKPRKANTLGSGFIIQVDKDFAYVVTNNHVVEKAKKVVVFLSDKTELPAEVHATDPRTDVAVLSVSLKGLDFDKSKLIPMKWGNSDKLNEGNFVVAIGNPFGLGSTVTHGIVSAKGRNISMGKSSYSLADDFIQHSAPINMGNSGGALLNVHGEVIGINTAIFSTSGGNIGIGFAIPSNLAKMTVDQLIKHKRTFRGWLGAEVHPVTAKQAESVGLIDKSPLDSSKVYGAYVARVVPEGPAEKSGIKVGDMIIEFNGKKISETCSLQMAVGTAEIGKLVKVKVWRQKDNEKWGAVEVKVKIGDFENAMKNGEIDTDDGKKSDKEKNETEATIDTLGVTVSAVPAQRKSDYPESVKVVVTKVDDEKETSFYGSVFMPGDGFISANNKKVTSVSQFKKIMKDLEKDKKNRNRPVPFVIVRDGFQMMIATTLDFSENAEKRKSDG